MSLAKVSSPKKQMVDNIKRASRQSDPVTRETNLMEEAIRPPSPFLHLLQPNKNITTSHNVIPPNLGEHNTEIASIETVGSMNGISMTEGVSVPLSGTKQDNSKSHGDSNDNNLNTDNSRKLNSITAARKLAGISIGKNMFTPLSAEDNVTSSLPAEDKRPIAKTSKLFTYRPVNGPTACRNLPPLLTPGANLVPELLKEVRAGWEITSGSLASDLGLHWLRAMAVDSRVFSLDTLPPLTISMRKKIREFIGKEGNSIRELIAKLAAELGASFILTGDGRSKWLRLGPSEGIRLVLDEKRHTLKVWQRPNDASCSSQGPGDPAQGGARPSELLPVSCEETSVPITCSPLVGKDGPSVLEAGTGDTISSNENEMSGFSEDMSSPILRDSLGRIRTQEDLDEEITFTQRPTISQRVVPMVSATRLYMGSPGIEELINRCRDWDGPLYPPPGANETFAGVLCRLKVAPSTISGKGTFLVNGSIDKHELLGFYEGLTTLLGGPYVMVIFNGTAVARRIDGCPITLGHESPFGMMNEDLYAGIPNVEVLPSGLFRAVRRIHAGEELVIRYAKGYDWGHLKSLALAGLSDEIASCVPELWHWIPKTWENLKRPTNPLSRWIKKLVDGVTERDTPHLLHSSSNNGHIINPRERLARLLTSGLTARRFNFRNWNRENSKIWPSVPYEHDAEQRGGYSKSWNYHRLMDIPFETVYRDNENIKNFCQELYRMQQPKTVPRLVACPTVTVGIGELIISLNLGRNKLAEHLGAINRCANHEQLAEYARRARIWKVSYRNNPLDDAYPGDGWCGYLAIDQIIRDVDSPANIKVPSDQRLLASTLGDIVKYGIGHYRVNWRSLRLGAVRYDKEVVLSVIDTLTQATSFLPPPVLHIERWLPTRMLMGLFSKHNFSKWTMDPDNEDFNILADGQLSCGSTTNVEEWRIVSLGKLMTIRRGHYHVRSASWQDDMEEGFIIAIRKLGVLMGLPCSSLPNASVGLVPTQAFPPSSTHGLQKPKSKLTVESLVAGDNRRPRGKKSRSIEKETATADNPLEAQEVSLPSIPGRSDPEKVSMPQEMLRDGPEMVDPISDPAYLIPANTRAAEFKAIFWNANTWNAQNCEKLVASVTESKADVICITDARLDNFKVRYIGGYCHTLQKATGKSWRAKLEARPDRRLKCMVGGDILFYSEKCTKVIKSPLLPYGTVSSLSLLWEGVNIRVISAYRPYDNKEASEGALRTAALRVLPGFEEAFWEEITKPSDVKTIIGGDFNMGVEELDKRLLGTAMSRVSLPEGVTTYMSLSHSKGSVIDHVISNPPNARSQVTPDGSFVGDHFPLIGSLLL